MTTKQSSGQFTAGPWRAQGSAVVCDTPTRNSKGEDEADKNYYGGYLVAESVFNPANARLIAAAPMMYAALKELSMLPNKKRPDWVWEQAMTVISAACPEQGEEG